MTDRIAHIRTALATGPVAGGALCAGLGVTRPTLARALASMPGEIVTWGAARSTRYALRDTFRGLPDIPVYRVNAAGQIEPLGQLIAVRPDGFVMRDPDGAATYSEGLPWWLTDMRPQGFIGRAYAHQHAADLGLPADVRYWSDTDALRALLRNGGDAVGNLLLGDLARDRFVNAAAALVVDLNDYPRLAAQSLTVGDTWSSAAGEQPKFCAYGGKGHVLVKFTVPADNAIAARWRDLLLAEHLALETLAAGGVSAAFSRVVDVGTQRFLELQRFDRVGALGRHALLSLAALDGEFVGNAIAPWPVVTAELARQKTITAQAHADATLLFAFGTLIGNTDMHAENLSFVGDEGRPYALSPAYDMLPMAFSPIAGGVVRDTVATAHIHPAVQGARWRAARALAQTYLARVGGDARFSAAFRPCIEALREHLEDASQKIDRLG
ncbi:MAG: type II toxin-antitoxin system HipA family toxin YjjJ [Burkholderiales bacterium]|nr:type II toxin-antitoxin system HipA family toxin YjjJ [Burkholderiales bacterium]